jgi:hypothetical protein
MRWAGSASLPDGGGDMLVAAAKVDYQCEVVCA